MWSGSLGGDPERTQMVSEDAVMSGRFPFCQVDGPGFATVGNFDGVSFGHGAAGVMLGIFGVRPLALALLLAGWEAVGYVVTACGAVPLLDPFRGLLRPSLGDVVFVVGGWTLGRLLRALEKRRSERRLI